MPAVHVVDAYNLDFLHARYPQASYRVCELYMRGKCPHGKEGLNEVDGEQCKELHPKEFIAPELEDLENEDLNEGSRPDHRSDGVDPSEDNRPMCKFFLRTRCKHGISGKNCSFQHKFQGLQQVFTLWKTQTIWLQQRTILRLLPCANVL